MAESRAPTKGAPSVIVSGHLYVEPTKRAAFLRARLAVMRHARAAPGCLDWTLSADPLDSGRINVYEAWSSNEALDTYRAGDGPAVDSSVEPLSAEVHRHQVVSTGPP
jgi:quinol monooxygenase YgiN